MSDLKPGRWTNEKVIYHIMLHVDEVTQSNTTTV